MYTVAIAISHEDMKTVYDTLNGRISYGYFTSMKEQTERAKEIIMEIWTIATSHDYALVTGRDDNNT
ncbi:MAG: hypothetical protein IJI68_00080 [Eggerthellaceae bacterium]|nr:hypothetical protein [Eggerthellaceae bacterium]